MLTHLYENFADTTDAAFGNGVDAAITSGLSAVAGPLTALLVIYVVLTGFLVMRGDLAARPGIFRVVRAGAVVMLLSATTFNTYVRDVFVDGLPAWFARSLTPGGTVAGSIPQQLDLIRSATLHLSAVIYQNTDLTMLDSRMSARLADGAVGIVLGAADLIYVIARAFTRLVVAIGPFVLAGFLFGATKPIVEGWIGKLVSLSILSLLVSIMARLVVAADALYVRRLANDIGSGATEQVENLWGLVVFFGLCTVLLVGLPGLAYSIGRGIAISTNLAGWWGAPARALDRIRVPSLGWRGR